MNAVVHQFPPDPEENLERSRKRAFAKAFAHTGTLSAALRAGLYDGRNLLKGVELLRDPCVMDLVKAERNFMAENYPFTKEVALSQLAMDREFAYSNDNPGAAAAATVSQARVAGLLQEDKDAGRNKTFVLRIDPALLP